MQRTQKGFTLLEVLMVVAAIAILAGLTVIAINPGRQLMAARDAQREVDVHILLSAVHQYAGDNNGDFPSTIPTESDCATATGNELCRTGASGCSGYVSLAALTSNERYLIRVPSDPSVASISNGVGYRISRSVNGRISVCAPLAEGNDEITVTR